MTAPGPADAGFFMPAEWAPHARCWMMWPTRAEVWEDIEATRRAYVEVARAIQLFEPVTMVAAPGDAAAARHHLGPAIKLLEAPIDDSWSRDAGPCFLLDRQGRLAGVDFRFNAWGDKYRGYGNDERIAARILDAAGARRFVSPLTAEGGGITVDGEGTLITTESCFPNDNRNPDWTRAEIEAELKRCCGVETVIWLPGDPGETETDGHVDGIAVFARPGLVVMAAMPDTAAAEHRILRENHAALHGRRDAKGRTIEVVTVDNAIGAAARSERFCRSYVNFYLANDALLMPCYGVAQDAVAFALFRRLFPKRTIVPLAIDEIAVGGGGIHCITQQQPRARDAH